MTWPSGRRRKDLDRRDIHTQLAPGDYWKILGPGGGPLRSTHPENLTGTCWYVVVARDDGYAIGRIEKHTVREEDDGTISVRSGDGSPILITRGENSWHGYIEHGVFAAC